MVWVRAGGVIWCMAASAVVRRVVVVAADVACCAIIRNRRVRSCQGVELAVNRKSRWCPARCRCMAVIAGRWQGQHLVVGVRTTLIIGGMASIAIGWRALIAIGMAV